MPLRRGRPLLLAAVLAVLSAGCGGTATYTAVKTRHCLAQRAVSTSGRVDFIASTAPGGSFVAHLGGNFATISFGQDTSQAETLVAGYTRAAFANVRPGLADVLRRFGNAVTLWHEHPNDSDLSLVVGCLR
jgi:hypothetical protein